MPISTEQLVGRGPELERLEELLDGLERGSSVSVVVEGEPGIGKTRLLAELGRRAEARGHLVLAGSAAEFERDLPFGLWVDALDAYVASQELEGRAGVDPDLLDELAGVLPSLRRKRASPGVGGTDQRHRAHRALRWVLGLIAEPKPMVLVLDDLHWSDAASVEVLAGLMRRGVPDRVLLALGYRVGSAPGKLRSALAEPETVVIELGPLTEPECSALAGGDLSAGRRASIFAESGGNPFYALQLGRASESPSHSSRAERLAVETGVPRAVAATLVEEFESLSPDARALVQAGAIAGDPFEPELAYAISELSAEAGVAALDELLDVRLLHATDVPRRFAFRHPLVRRAVYESIKGGWRLAAHGRAAHALGGRGASPTARAHHVEHSAVQGDHGAIELLLAAGDADAPRAPGGAARWYAAALRLMPEDDRRARVRALISLAQVQRSTGDLVACRSTLLQALELIAEEESAPRVGLTAACAAAEHFLGRHESAQRRLTAALASLPDQGSREAVTVLLAMVAGAFFALDAEGGCILGRRALAAAHRLDEPELIGAAAAALAHAAANAGAVPETESAVGEASVRLDALADDALARYLDAVNRVAWSEFLIERYEDSIRHARRGVTVARATGQDQFVPMLAGVQALSTMVRGDLAAAAALQVEALETAELAANDYVTCWVLTSSAHVATAAGDLDGARRAGERAVGLVEGHHTGRVAAMARLRLAATRRQLGESAGATAALVATAGGWGLPMIPPSWRVGYAETMTRVELTATRPEQAEIAAACAEGAARELGLPLAAAVAERARAAMQLAGGDAAGAARQAQISSDRAVAAGAPIEAARSLALAGRAVAAAGDRARAVQLLRDAETRFDTCGALRDRAETRHELRRLGARAEPRGPSTGSDGGIESLSPREREIAQLVTARKTNREMATELFLSEKTIESHLRNIFAKLGASSRVEVARAMERSQQQTSS